MATTTGLTSAEILAKYEKSYNEAKAANEQRYQQGMGILDQAVQRYQPGGGFGAGAMAQYEQGKTKGIASGMQSLVSSGLSNTTVAAGLPMAYEQEIGTPFRLQLEDMRMQNLTQAEQAKTNFISARQDPYPDFGMFAQLSMQAATAGGGGTNYAFGPNAAAGLDVFGQPLGKYTGGSASRTQQTSPSDVNSMLSQTMGGGTGSGGFSNWAFGSKYGQTPTTGTGTGTGGATPSMDESEYQALLQKNLQQNKASTSKTISESEAMKIAMGGKNIEQLRKEGWGGSGSTVTPPPGLLESIMKTGSAPVIQGTATKSSSSSGLPNNYAPYY